MNYSPYLGKWGVFVGICYGCVWKEKNDDQPTPFKGNPARIYLFESFPMERGVALDAGPYFKDAFDDGEV